MFSLQKRKWQLCEVMEMLINPTVVITFQYTSVTNHHVVYLKVTQCFISITGLAKKFIWVYISLQNWKKLVQLIPEVQSLDLGKDFI